MNTALAVDEIRRGLQVTKQQWALYDAVEAAREIDTRSFELGDGARLRTSLVPRVLEVLEQALTVLDELLEHYDDTCELESPQNSGVFNAVFEDIVDEGTRPAHARDPHRHIIDVGFIARWELVRKREALRAAVRLDDWSLIAACCSTRRRVIKALGGVERVVSSDEARPSVFANLYLTERDLAVETRAVYLRFIEGLRKIEERTEPLSVERSLRLAGTGIAALVGRAIYEELRIEDRRALRELQVRLFDWLREPKDERAGRRLLADLSAFGSLLLGVNRRPALVEHDRELLERLLQALDAPHRAARARLEPELVRLRGRDAELDALLDAGAPLEDWRAPALRALAQLQG